MKGKIVIIDGNSLINRAYYAMQKPMMTRDNIYTQGIYGFLNMLSKINKDQEPDYIVVAWDRKAPTFRHEQYKDYKAGRKKMPPELAMELPIMKEILSAMRVENLEIDGFEADDIIGTVARIAEEEGLEPVIITGDRDALQLCTDRTKVLITKRGISEFDLYDREKMIERYELTPEQFVDLKGLMGDQSDNIPGIPGVGEKTGIKLLKQFGSVAQLLARTEEISNEKLRNKVEDNAQLAAMSRKLAEINTFVPLDIDIESYRVKEPDTGKLVEIYTRLEFNRFLRDLKTEEDPVLSDQEEEDISVVEISSSEDFRKIEDQLNGSVYIKVFGSSDHVGTPYPENMAVLKDDTMFFVSGEDVIGDMVSLFNRNRPSIAGHDLSTDYYILMSRGMISPVTEYDTKVAEYVIDPGKSNYDIRTLSFEYLRRDVPSEKEFLEQDGQMDILGDSSEKRKDYAMLLLTSVRKIRNAQEEKLSEGSLKELLTRIELPLIEVLASMEIEGIHIDVPTLDVTGDLLKEEIVGLENTIYELAGEEFNINSPAQLGPILFEKLGLPSGKKTKRGYSTSADVLNKLLDKHPIIEKILTYRTMTKLNSTYIEGLKPLVSSEGKIHAHFQQTVAATGRLSCTEPNLQNIPVRYQMGRELRKAFVAGEGNVFVGADYSQIELRIMAHLSGDENLISAFNSGEDIHRMTAARVFELDPEKVTSLDRSRAKAVNFGVIYGMSGFGLSEELHITRKEAESYINDYFDKHKAVKDYLDGQIELCKQRGYSETIFGRRRYIAEINSGNYMTRQFGERLAMNSPIQGSAADIIKIAMNKVYGELKAGDLKAKLILQIHDELIIEVPEDEVEQVKELLVRNMESAADLAVKLTSDMNVGRTWYDLKD